MVSEILEELRLTPEETGEVAQALEAMVRERAGATGAAELANPVNIGIGTK